MSLLHQGTLKNSPIPAGRCSATWSAWRKSRSKSRRKIEAADNVDFETYRARYLSPDLLKL